MDLKEMSISELEERKNAIVGELDVPEADLDALEAEMKSINEELESRRAEEAKKTEIRDMVAQGAGTVIETPIETEERHIMTNEEIRNSAEYIDAYANYIKTGRDEECRSLLTTNATGGDVPVPEIVEQIVRTAWEDEKILARVTKTNIRGNLKVPFELSATGAVLHTEGAAAPSEETLKLGIVEMVPSNIKKWITVSDEVLAMGGEAFLNYIYREITHKIMQCLAGGIVGTIVDAGSVPDAANASVAFISEAPGVTTVGHAFANLSDEADDIVVIMNKLTYADFLDAQAQGNFSVDPFRGFPVLFNNTLPAYTDASEDDVYMIVGDLKGMHVNYPEGEGIVLKYDDLSLAEKDLVKIVGRQYVAVGLTACGRFCNVTKPGSGT